MKKMTEPNKKKIRFVNNIWITGFYEGKEILGRTFELNGIEMVTILTQNAKADMVTFQSIENISKIVVVTNKEKNAENQEIDFSENLSKMLAMKNISNELIN